MAQSAELLHKANAPPAHHHMHIALPPSTEGLPTCPNTTECHHGNTHGQLLGIPPSQTGPAQADSAEQRQPTLPGTPACQSTLNALLQYDTSPHTSQGPHTACCDNTTMPCFANPLTTVGMWHGAASTRPTYHTGLSTLPQGRPMQTAVLDVATQKAAPACQRQPGGGTEWQQHCIL